MIGINPVFYRMIDNKEFFKEIKKSQEQDRPTDRFMIICYSIAYKILRQGRFFKTTQDWKEDSASYSLIKCCASFHKYDITRGSSAYAFFHTTIKRSIYDSFAKYYYNYFTMKRDLMQFSSCYEETDPFFDEINQESEEEENSEVISISIEDYEKEKLKEIKDENFVL